MAINEQELRERVRKMSRQSRIYRILKEELSVLGYWKARKRGDSALGYANGIGKTIR